MPQGILIANVKKRSEIVQKVQEIEFLDGIDELQA